LIQGLSLLAPPNHHPSPFYTDGQFAKIGIEKLVALIPKPRSHLVRYHGVFTPNARLRKKVVAKAPKAKRGEGGEHTKGCTKKRMDWHWLFGNHQIEPTPGFTHDVVGTI